MSKSKKTQEVYYIAPKNDSANSVVEDIAGFCIHTDFEKDVKVFDLDENGKQKENIENLCRMPSYDGVVIMNANRNRKGLKFKVFVQETPGSKIIRWFPDWKNGIRKIALKRASSMLTE